VKIGAGDGIRTRDQELGKLLLYQLSYARSSEVAGFYNGMPRITIPTWSADVLVRIRRTSSSGGVTLNERTRTPIGPSIS
jgi:hypothetical protein